MSTPTVPLAAIAEAERRVAAAAHVLAEARAGRWTVGEGTIDALERLCTKAIARLRSQPDLDWECLAHVYVDHEDPARPEAAAVLHAGAKWAENDHVDRRVRP